MQPSQAKDDTLPDRTASGPGEQLHTLVQALPVPQPSATLVWTAAVTIGERESLGPCAEGERFIVPITGGFFWGGPSYPGLTGVVRPGGADRQLLRADGVKRLSAVYEMQTQDGAVLSIDNQVTLDDSVQPQRYAMSHLRASAPPDGPHAWLNRRMLVGTLQVLRPAAPAVVIRAYLLAP